jgi:hypothetical protein
MDTELANNISEVKIDSTCSAAWGGRVDVYWRRDFSRKHRYRAISKAIGELVQISDRDWNMRHTDRANVTTIYFRDVTDAVNFGFYYS